VLYTAVSPQPDIANYRTLGDLARTTSLGQAACIAS